MWRVRELLAEGRRSGGLSRLRVYVCRSDARHVAGQSLRLHDGNVGIGGGVTCSEFACD